MAEFLISVLVISSIGAGLALLLVIAERFIANYGQCQIDINGERQLTVKGGKPLLDELVNGKIFIPSACGGKGTCGYCKCKVLTGVRDVLPTETPFLTEEELADNMRLSCQVKVRQDMRIEIPEELFSVRQYSCTCESIADLTGDIKLFRFRLDDSETIDYVPGQYMQLLAPVYTKGGEEVYRAYSIASDPNEKDAIELIIRLVPGGICTTYCFDHLKVGDQVKMNGPYGDFRLDDTDAEMVFVAGGSGMAPFRSMLYDMKNNVNSRRVSYYFGANKVEEMFMAEQMEEFEDVLEDFTFIPVVAQLPEGIAWQGQTGFVTHAVKRSVKQAKSCEGYMCGSPGMIDATIKVLCELGMEEDKIYYDKFV